MIPAFVSDDYLQSRLRLPFGKPMYQPNIMGFDARSPLIKQSIRLQPMPDPMPSPAEIASTKGYFFGGLIPRGGTLEEFAARNPTPKSIGQRINDFGNDNKELLSALSNIYRK